MPVGHDFQRAVDLHFQRQLVVYNGSYHQKWPRGRRPSTRQTNNMDTAQARSAHHADDESMLKEIELGRDALCALILQDIDDKDA